MNVALQMLFYVPALTQTIQQAFTDDSNAQYGSAFEQSVLGQYIRYRITIIALKCSRICN
jgi:hypothetical protein